MTLQEQITKAEQDHAAHVAKLQQEHAVREALAALAPWITEYEDPRIYVSPLYGRVGSITFKHDRFRYGNREDWKPQPDRALAERLMQALPAVPITKFKDSCLSFRTTAYVDAMPDDKLERVDLTPVAPWLIKTDPNHFSEDVELSWCTEIAGQVWEISVEFARHACQIGEWDIQVRRTSHGEIDHVVRCHLRPHDGKAWREAPEPPQVIKWGGGGPTSLNSFTLWWYDSEPEVLDHIRRGILAALPEAKS